MRPPARVLPVLVAGALLLACASRGVEIREYVLGSVATPLPGSAAAGDLAIGVGPVVVPRYLRRSGIVTRIGANELRASDTHRWGEDLDRGLARVVAGDLAVLVPGSRVRAFPWREQARLDYRVAIEVESFEPSPDGSVALAARWAVLRGADESRVAGSLTSVREESAGAGHAAVVETMSRAAGRLSREIAAAIQTDAAPVTAE